MFDWLLFANSSVLGLSIIFSYVLVLGNITGTFSFENYVSSYLESPYWFNITRNNVVAIICFQVFAGVGYVLWLFWLCSETNFGTSILKYRWSRTLFITGFLVSSVLWPYAAYYYMLNPSFTRSIIACACLWSASLFVILMTAGTFEANPPAYATAGILLLATVVVMADGVGWSARCIQDSIYNRNT